MLETISPVRFHAATKRGRTRPSRLECEKADGSYVEVVGKFSAGCDRRASGLAMEVVAACLAGDLGLPVPHPYLLDVDRDFVASVTDAERKTIMEASLAAGNRLGFGSTEAGNGFAVWSNANRITDAMAPEALGIFCFDAFTVNADRQADNPNCLVRGSNVRIIDHESSFIYRMVLNWKQPWIVGALMPMTTPGHHIFYSGLKDSELDFAPVETAWRSLTDDRLNEYRDCVPAEWSADAAVDDALKLIKDVRDNIAGALAEVERILS